MEAPQARTIAARPPSRGVRHRRVVDAADRRPAGLVAARQEPDRGVRLVDGVERPANKPARAASRARPTRSRRMASSSSPAICSRAATATASSRRSAARCGSRMPFRPGATATLDGGADAHCQCRRRLRRDSPTKPSTVTAAPRVFYVSVGAAAVHSRELPDRTVLRRHRPQSFVNSLTVTIPSTIIPILIAAFAAYALAWMQLPFRGLIIAIIVGLLVVPLQMSLIPLLRLYNTAGTFMDVPSKTYLGIWLAHTAFRPAVRHLSAAELHRRPAARPHREWRKSTAPTISRSSAA